MAICFSRVMASRLVAGMLLLGLLFTAPRLLAAANAIQISDSTYSELISLDVRFLYVKADKTATLQQIMALPDERWLSTGSGNPNFGPTTDVYWFSVALQFNKRFSGILQIDRPYMDFVDIYIIEQGAVAQQFLLGDQRPFAERAVHHPNFVVPLDADAGDHMRLLLRVHSQGTPLQFEAWLSDRQSFYQADRTLLARHVFIVGAVLALVLYNLMLFLSIRRSMYLAYACYALFITFTWFFILGYGAQYLPASFAHLLAPALATVAALSRLCMFIFFILFFSLHQQHKKLFTLMAVLAAAEALTIVIVLLGYSPFRVIPWLYILQLNASFPIVVLSGIYLWWQGDHQARFFTMAWVMHIIGGLPYLLCLIGKIAYSSLYLQMGMAAMMAEMVLLAFALADRSKAIEAQLLQTKDDLLYSQDKQHVAEQLAVEAKAASRAKSDFLAAMSHEIRTPMNAILGYVQLMALDKSLNAEQQQHLNIINRSSEHLLGLINDVLDMAKIEAGQTSLAPSQTNIAALIDDIALMMRARCEQKGLILKVDKHSSVPETVLIDGAKLRQILLNLIGNSLKFTQQGGITLRASADSTDEEGGGSGAAQVLLRFEVEDTGDGIAKEQHDKVFRKFEQTDAGEKSGGTGLGLAISRELARKMGGDIAFVSDKGQGATFTATVTARPLEVCLHQEALQQRNVVGIEPDGLAARRILIVDDIATNRDILAAFLQPVGFICEFACNGEEALQAFLQQSYDLILMDIRMPKMDGMAAIERIRATRNGKTLPIVVISASVFEADRKRILKLGANDFIYKPFKSWQVFNCLKTLLGLEYIFDEQDNHSNAIAVQATEKTVHANNAESHSLKLLVAEDNPSNRLLIEKQLASLDLVALIVENGQLAVDAIKAAADVDQAFDIVLMDCEMPEMNGYQAAESIRQWEQTLALSPLHIVALTAHQEGVDTQHALDCGMDAVLRKPISIDDLRNLLVR